MEKKYPGYARAIFYLLLFLTVIACVAVLKVTYSFFMPLTIALLLSFVFYPFVKKLHSFHVPWVCGILIVVLLAAATFYVIGNLLAASCKAVLSAYPRYEARFSSIYALMAKRFNLPLDENSSLFANLWNSLGVRNFVQDAALTASNYIFSILKLTLVISLFIIFFMVEIRGMKDKIYRAFPKERMGRKIMFIITKIIAEVTRYISIKFMVSLFTGILVFALTFFLGMDFAVIWGFLAFILNFIPNFGTMVSWAITTGFSVLQFYPSGAKIFVVAAGVFAINFVLGNIIEPRWEGSNLGISPFLILVSLSLWGWLWGFSGMILSVPILVVIKIIFENIDFLNPLAVLLGNSRTFRKKRFSARKKFQPFSSSAGKNSAGPADSADAENSAES